MSFIPNFNDDSNDGRKIAFICTKANLDMAYPALIMGNAALGEGVEVDIFFSFWGFDLIMKSRQDNLKFNPAGNTGMHLPGSDAHFPQSMSLLPGMTAMATWMLKREFDKLDVPPVSEFLDIITASGGRLWGCKLSADMYGVEEKDLRDDVGGIITAADFIEIAKGAQVIFV
jgi:peroxiredoxin family protein